LAAPNATIFSEFSTASPFAATREAVRQQAFACAQIRHDERRQNPQEQMSERLPGAAGTVNAVETAGNLLKKDLRLFLAAGEDTFEIDLVAACFRRVPSRRGWRAG